LSLPEPGHAEDEANQFALPKTVDIDVPAPDCDSSMLALNSPLGSSYT
jgi:hypothetical protein